ncbi:MAG: NAD-dependent epimerase/dehydratase family protein [Ignavibacteriae bacterium]|nr:MAG: NAD-dependent epimerase/dehydratase family protein [Ignavibacteriota bacterium]
MKPSTIFVTGSTGFIGTKLVNELVRQGHTVHALSRAASNRDGLSHERIRVVVGDIMHRESLVAGMKGCTHVFHLAAYAKNWAREKKIFYDHNVVGMKNVLAAAQQTGIERVVWTSTIVTFGPTAAGVIGDETMPRITAKYYTEYEETKAIAEQEALSMATDGYPVVMVNPTRVYGPGKLTEGNSVSLMIDQYDRGLVPILLNNGVNIGNYAYVDDLVRGHILALEKGRTGERYILGGENASLKKFYELVDEVSGKKHYQINLPPKVGLAYGGIQKFAADTFGLYPQITTGWVETFLQDWAYTCAKAERELGYTITPLKEGIRQTYEWILQQRQLRKART